MNPPTHKLFTIIQKCPRGLMGAVYTRPLIAFKSSAIASMTITTKDPTHYKKMIYLDLQFPKPSRSHKHIRIIALESQIFKTREKTEEPEISEFPLPHLLHAQTLIPPLKANDRY